MNFIPIKYIYTIYISVTFTPEHASRENKNCQG